VKVLKLLIMQSSPVFVSVLVSYFSTFYLKSSEEDVELSRHFVIAARLGGL
jgi:hypothetical protein